MHELWARELPWGDAPIIVTGLGFGDEGKGATVDALVRRLGIELVVRHNGGPQAAHHVVGEDGGVHCFAQFGSGTLVPGVRTHLARDMLVEPLALGREAAALERLGVAAPLGRVTIDPGCVVVTPFHRLIGRMQELARGTGRHGSCGMGIGAAHVDAADPRMPTLRFAELGGPTAPLRSKLRLIQMIKLDRAEQLVEQRPADPELMLGMAEIGRPGLVDDILAAYAPVVQALAVDDGEGLRAVLRDRPGRVIFEGAQGVLLDARRGFWPYVTPSRTDASLAEVLLAEAGAPPPLRLWVLRAYATRHGPGPFVSELAGMAARVPERHNLERRWQGPMRVGAFDLVAARHALELAGSAAPGVDALVLTCLDRLAGLGPISVCTAYVAPEGAVRDHLDPPPADRDAQAQRSAGLMRCTPVLTEHAGWDEPGLPVTAARYARSIADALERPLAGLGTGETAADRCWAPSTGQRAG